jgi:hypothetical protein
MMDMKSRNQLLNTLITQHGGYHLKTKKKKSLVLNQYCKVTGENRKAVSRKIRTGKYIYTLRREKRQEKRHRSSPYTKEIIAYLIQLWEIFDRPCGQRLVPMIRTELDRLRRFQEFTLSNETSDILKKISARTIDTHLQRHKEKERLKRKYEVKCHPLLYQKIPVKLSSEQGHGIGESIQIDLVEHCGQSANGPFLCTLSVTDVGSGWWEGEVIFGKSAWSIADALGRIQYRFPFPWKEIHSDNGSEFINEVVWQYARRNKLGFSRSRPYAKNDNCFVEQKNSTHVRKIVGYHRYNTKPEHEILRQLYRNDLRLYKNFFQVIIPLVSKERMGGHIKRTYGNPQTPYQRLLEWSKISKTAKKILTALYTELNPAELRRNIQKQQDTLYQTYLKKQGNQPLEEKLQLDNLKKSSLTSATFLIAEPIPFRAHSLIA